MNDWTTAAVFAGLLIFFAGSVLLWRRRKTRSPQGNRTNGGVRAAIRQWLGVPSLQELAELESRICNDYEGITGRVESLQSTLVHQERLEGLTTDIRRRLARVETVHQEGMTGQSPRQVGSGSILRLGVRLTFTDRLWDILGIANPSQLTDEHIDKILQGPFCRNCLRSLIARSPQDGNRHLQTTCRHCSLIWRSPPDAPSLSLLKWKRHVYNRLDAEYREKGAIGVPEEMKTDEQS